MCHRCNINNNSTHQIFIQLNEDSMIKVESCSLLICKNCGCRIFKDDVISEVQSSSKEISKMEFIHS